MKELREQLKACGNKAAAAAVGKKLAEVAKSKGIGKVVFDRNFYRFHGRVRAFAEAAAAGGLDFLRNPKKKDKPPKEAKAKPEGKPAKGEKPKGEKPAKEKKPQEPKQG
jgi:large subunit ribosomal protein L18